MSVEHDITAEVLQGKNFRALHAGDDYDYQVTVQRASAALDLTGAIVWLTVKDDSLVTDAGAKLQLVSTDTTQIEITSPTNGRFVIKFRGTGSKATADLEGLWHYDIQVKLSAGTIITIARGRIEFLDNLTRATS